MKAHTSSFKDNVPKFGRELDSKITYELNGETIELGSEQLNSVTPHYEGAILKSVMKQLDIDSNVEIPVGTILTYQFGLKVSNEYEYINYGNYIVKLAEKQEDTRSWQITCYDKMLYAMKDYENSDITFPITVKDYLEAICEKVGLEYEGSAFANSDKIIANELFLDTEGRSMNYTFRDVLDEIAQVSGGTVCINKDDKLEVRYIKDVGELVNVTGSSLTLETDEEVELDNFELEGKTTQETREGYNLYDFINNPYTTEGSITVEKLSNGYSLTNNSGTASRIMFTNVNAESSKSYVLSFELNNPNGLSVRVGWAGSNKYIDATTNGKKTSVLTGIITSVFSVYCPPNSTITVTNLMYYEGTDTTKEYEPYGVSPSPDYPSELVSVGYTNLMPNNKVPDYAGAYAWQGYGDNSYTQDGNSYSFAGRYRAIAFQFNNLTEGETYTVSWNAVANGNYTAGIGINVNLSNTEPNTSSKNYNITATEQRFTFSFTAGEHNRLAFNSGTNSAITNITISDIQVELGEQHPYISYGKYGIEVKTTGKNLLPSISNTTTISGITFTKNIDGSITINGTATSNALITIYGDWSGTVIYQRLDSSKYYTISGSNNANIQIFIRTTNGTTITSHNPQSNPTFTGQSGIVNYFIQVINGTVCNNVIIKPQLEENTQATEYEPYKENTQLYQLDEPLRAIGEYKDRLYIENGMLFVERKIGSIILNGSENGWNVFRDNDLHYNYYIHREDIAKTIITCLSNYFKYKTSGNNSIGEFQIGGNNPNKNGNIVFNPFNDTTSDLLNFKNWLSTHNTEVQYPLADTYTEEIGQVDMPSTYDGITYIETTDVLEPTMNVSYISEFEEIDEEYLKDVNVNFGEKFGPVNTIVLSRGGDGDKISLSMPSDLADEDKVAIQITDNQIMNGNDRNEYMPAILNKLYGLEYYINDFTSTGICYLDLCDRYNIKIGDNIYKCIMFNDEVNITQGLQENIYTDMQEENEQEYKYMNSTDRGITQANIIANKVEATVTEYTQKIDETNNRLNAVETKQTATDRTINIISTHIDENGNVTEVTTITGFTFNAEGMTIQDNQTNFKALHRNTGTFYYDGDTLIGQYTNTGSKQKDLQLFGVYYYGMRDINDTPMFVSQLYTDDNGDECVGHFYNGGN